MHVQEPRESTKPPALSMLMESAISFVFQSPFFKGSSSMMWFLNRLSLLLSAVGAVCGSLDVSREEFDLGPPHSPMPDIMGEATLRVELWPDSAVVEVLSTPRSRFSLVMCGRQVVVSTSARVDSCRCGKHEEDASKKVSLVIPR